MEPIEVLRDMFPDRPWLYAKGGWLDIGHGPFRFHVWSWVSRSRQKLNELFESDMRKWEGVQLVVRAVPEFTHIGGEWSLRARLAVLDEGMRAVTPPFESTPEGCAAKELVG